MEDIAVIGNGGHSKVVQEMIRSSSSYRMKAILDDKYEELASDGGIFTGPLASVQALLHEIPQLQFIVAIGNNETRQTIISRLSLPVERYVSIIHPSAIVSSSASVGRGTVVMANAVIQADASVGNHVIINTGSVIEHDNKIGDYVHAAPRATLTGSVNAEEGAMIGAGAVVIPGKTIGAWAVIGAGATVIHDIPQRSTAVGTPAKLMIR